MISNHFPSTYGHEYNWAILAGLSVFSILVRHYFNTRHGSQKFAWTIPAAALGMVTLAFVSSPYASKAPTPVVKAPVTQTSSEQAQTGSEQIAQSSGHDGSIPFSQINQVIQERCSVCHSATPTHAAFQTAPGGVVLDTPEEIKVNVPRIIAQTVTTKVMPLGNLTQMTDEERTLIGQWVEQGAQIQ